MDHEDTVRPSATTLKPPTINENDFKCGYNMARVASIEVLKSITGKSDYSLRMGYIAYVALTTNHFPDIDCIRAAEFAENLKLGNHKS